ncbi:hypothetical protein QL285_049774 [Trifolium repens]|nr:hypothetical protein QL285_049774 [Trifolium repens]
MNIPNLTRAHVASHLQKYRLNMDDKVAEKGTIGDISHRALRSTLASNLPTSMIKEIQEMRTEKLRAPTLYQIGAENNVFNIFNNFPSNKSEFPYLQKPRVLETNSFANTNFSSYGSRQGLMASSSSSANFLKRDFQFGETSNQNHGSIGNGYFNHINHGVKNWNLESMNNSSILAQNVTCDARNNNPFGIKINNISEMDGIGTMSKRGFDSIGIRDDNANSYNFALNGWGQNANVNFGFLGYENFGLIQGDFGSLSYVRGGSGSQFQDELFQGKVYENREIPLQKLDTNIVETEQNHSGGTSTNAVEFNQMEFDISNFSMADDMELLNKMNENNDASAFLKSDLINSIQDVQPLDQLYNGGGDASLVGNISCVLNESPISVNQNSMQLQGNEQFSNGMLMGDKVFNASTSASNPKSDMDLFEAVFGTIDN